MLKKLFAAAALFVLPTLAHADVSKYKIISSRVRGAERRFVVSQMDLKAPVRMSAGPTRSDNQRIISISQSRKGLDPLIQEMVINIGGAHYNPVYSLVSKAPVISGHDD